MPRKLRNHHPGAMYHVTLRGNNRQNIFFNNDDYQLFLNLLRHAKRQFQCKIHLYCLMTNHIHLVIEVNQVTLSKIMQTITSMYVRKINSRDKRVGHLFQGRHGASHIYDDAYLLELCYYIHMNPIKASIVQHLGDYPWSSHHCYANSKQTDFVTTSALMKILRINFGASKNVYASYMQERNPDTNPTEFCEFDTDGLLNIKDNINKSEKSKIQLNIVKLSLQDIADVIFTYFNIPIKHINSTSRERSITMARAFFANFAHYHAHYTIKEIAAFTDRSTYSVSRSMHGYLRATNDDKLLQHYLKQITHRLSCF